MKRQITAVQSDVSGLKSDMSTLKTDVSGLKTDVRGLKEDMRDLKAVVRRIAATTTMLSGKFDSMIERLATKDDIDGLNRRMDGFAGMHEDMRHRWAIHATTLSEHHKRLTKLESRRA